MTPTSLIESLTGSSVVSRILVDSTDLRSSALASAALSAASGYLDEVGDDAVEVVSLDDRTWAVIGETHVVTLGDVVHIRKLDESVTRNLSAAKVGEFWGMWTGSPTTDYPDHVLFVTGSNKDGSAKGVHYDVGTNKPAKKSFKGYTGQFRKMPATELDGRTKSQISRKLDGQSFEDFMESVAESGPPSREMQAEYARLSKMSLTALQGILRKLGYDGPRVRDKDQALDEIMALRFGAEESVAEADGRGAKMLQFIQDAWENGRTVYLQTSTRAMKFTPKNAAKFEKLGTPLVKLGSDGSLMAYEGSTQGKPRYVDATYTKLTAREESIDEGYQHVHFKGSTSVRFKMMMSAGKKKSVQGRTFDGNIAVHPTGNYQWGVSHVHSGYQLVPPPGFADDAQAVRFAKAVSAVGDWSWTDVSDMPEGIGEKVASLVKHYRPHIRKVGGGAYESIDEGRDRVFDISKPNVDAYKAGKLVGPLVIVKSSGWGDLSVEAKVGDKTLVQAGTVQHVKRELTKLGIDPKEFTLRIPSESIDEAELKPGIPASVQAGPDEVLIVMRLGASLASQRVYWDGNGFTENRSAARVYSSRKAASADLRTAKKKAATESVDEADVPGSKIPQEWFRPGGRFEYYAHVPLNQTAAGRSLGLKPGDTVVGTKPATSRLGEMTVLGAARSDRNTPTTFILLQPVGKPLQSGRYVQIAQDDSFVRQWVDPTSAHETAFNSKTLKPYMREAMEERTGYPAGMSKPRLQTAPAPSMVTARAQKIVGLANKSTNDPASARARVVKLARTKGIDISKAREIAEYRAHAPDWTFR